VKRAVIPTGAFGARVTQRLREETVVWLTTVGADGTPQPNPVWFLWEEPDTLLVYNRSDAHRLSHVARQPRVSLHFNDNRGGDVVVLTGTARVVERRLAHENPSYLAKYEAQAARVGGTPAEFAAQYPVALEITVERIRGF
jgi:PPOX class probable F420-dependent enzyme